MKKYLHDGDLNLMEVNLPGQRPFRQCELLVNAQDVQYEVLERIRQAINGAPEGSIAPKLDQEIKTICDDWWRA